MPDASIDVAAVERFIKYADTYLNWPQVSLAPIRERQDPALTSRLIERATARLEKEGLNRLDLPSFFVGSVDFMTGNGRRFYILETNGGSSRGFALLPVRGWEQAYDSYLETLADHPKPLVLIGHPDKDLIYYEKVFLAETFAARLGCRVVPARLFHHKLSRPHGLVVIGPYSELLPMLTLKDGKALLGRVPVDILIGDGLARRHPGIAERVLSQPLATVLVNEMLHVTDDKSLTYEAVNRARVLLERFRVHPIKCERAADPMQLEGFCREMLPDLGQVVIKPHGGSGGSGIEIIGRPRDINTKLTASIAHYRDKFGPARNPFPYTVCERVAATPVDWRGGHHYFDIRIYVGRRGLSVVPLGALVRLAMEPFVGRFTKKSFVVNLSGYGGVDTDRGLGLSDETLRLLGLTEQDFVDMFSAAATIITYIAKHFRELSV